MPFAEQKYSEKKYEEAAFELYELKRDQYKRYKVTGDIQYMNRFLELVDE